MYLTYEEYQNMGGTLDEPEFTQYERSARIQLDNYTYCRLKKDTEYPQEVKDCMFELIKLVQLKDHLINGGGGEGGEPQIESQSNDGVSISYNILSAADAYKVTKQEVVNVINQCLFNVRNQAGHRLTYKGVYPDE